MRVLEWQRTDGRFADAARLLAERTGRPVPGWSDRPRVPDHLRRVWDSFAAMVSQDLGERGLEFRDVGEWVDRVHWDECPEDRAWLFEVLLGLLSSMRRVAKEAEE